MGSGDEWHKGFKLRWRLWSRHFNDERLADADADADTDADDMI